MCEAQAPTEILDKGGILREAGFHCKEGFNGNLGSLYL